MGQELRQRAFQPGLGTPGRPEGLEQIKSHEIWICSLLLLWSVVGCPAPVFILRLYFSCLLALVTSGDEDPWNRASGGLSLSLPLPSSWAGVIKLSASLNGGLDPAPPQHPGSECLAAVDYHSTSDPWNKGYVPWAI